MPAESRPQRSRNPAEIYEEFFVPALFHDWAERIADVYDRIEALDVITRSLRDYVNEFGR